MSIFNIWGTFRQNLESKSDQTKIIGVATRETGVGPYSGQVQGPVVGVAQILLRNFGSGGRVIFGRIDILSCITAFLPLYNKRQLVFKMYTRAHGITLILFKHFWVGFASDPDLELMTLPKHPSGIKCSV